MTGATGRGDLAEGGFGEDRGVLPEEPFLRHAGIGGRGGKRRFTVPHWARWVALFGMTAFLAAGTARCVLHPKDLETMSVRMDTDEDRMKQVETRTSEEYRRNLDTYSATRSAEALRKNGTFIQPVTGVQPPRLLPEVKAPDVPAPKERQEPKTEVRVHPRARDGEKTHPPQPKRPVREEAAVPPRERKLRAFRERTGDPRFQGYLAQLRPSFGQPATLVLNHPAPRSESELLARAGQAGGGTSGGTGAALAATGLPGLNAGDMLYVLNRISLNSDAPGPAMAEVVVGPYRGAKVLGAFQRLGEHIVLKFNELVTAEGIALSIEGYAVDPDTDATAVRSGVDHHYLARWGGIVAASFLEGFGQAVERSGINRTTTVYGSSESYPHYDLNDQLWLGAAKVGNRASSLLDGQFGTPPTVTLRSGTEMAVLLLRTGTIRGGSGVAGGGRAGGVSVSRSGFVPGTMSGTASGSASGGAPGIAPGITSGAASGDTGAEIREEQRRARSEASGHAGRGGPAAADWRGSRGSTGFTAGREAGRRYP